MSDSKRCVMCGEPATHECGYSLGAAWHCFEPLCAKHTEDDHHPDDAAWRKFSAGEPYGVPKDDHRTRTFMWYAFMAGWREALRGGGLSPDWSTATIKGEGEK